MEKKKKRIIIILSSVGVVVTALGVAAIIIFRPTKGIDYEKISIDEENYDEVYELYKTLPANQYFTRFSGIQLANISLLKLRDTENFYSITEGKATALIQQKIKGTYIRNGDSYFEESLSSSSLVESANRFYQSGVSTKWYKGKFKSLEEGDYSKATLTEYTLEEMEQTWGKSLDDPCIYNVTSQTLLHESVEKNSDGTYTVSLDLDPTLSVTRYVKQMKITGGLDREPVFKSVNLKFVVDKDVKLTKFITDESYNVKKVIEIKNCTGTLTQTFTYSSRVIPSIKEKANYN